jgi:hypothetical protein
MTAVTQLVNIYILLKEPERAALILNKVNSYSTSASGDARKLARDILFQEYEFLQSHRASGDAGKPASDIIFKKISDIIECYRDVKSGLSALRKALKIVLATKGINQMTRTIYEEIKDYKEHPVSDTSDYYLNEDLLYTKSDSITII